MSDDSSSHNRPVDDPSAHHGEHAAAAGGAEGRPASGGIGGPEADGQKTVISQRPPISAPALRRAVNPFEMGEALAGEQLGHFQLEEFIGGGGMGVVFRATDTMLGRTVAVKVVSRDHTTEDARRRFRNEAQSAARLDHPNIARVYYVGEDKGWNYIVFEYIEGVNVRDLITHNGPLSLEEAFSYVLQIAEALEHASQRDVTHRDIKPSNILIMADGRAKLVDMGLARLQRVESSTEDLTASGVTLGTFDYISPEQARDPRNTDVRSDLYSLGCTFFFMLTGLPPFPDGTVLQKLLSHSSDTPPQLQDYRPDVDEEVSRLITKLLAKQPEQRCQSPRELIGELLLIADRLELPGLRPEGAIWLAHKNYRPAWWIRGLPWAMAVLALLLITGIFSWIDASTPIQIPEPPSLAASANRGASETDAMEDESPEGLPVSRSGPPPMEPATADSENLEQSTPGAISKDDRKQPVSAGNEASEDASEAKTQTPKPQSSSSGIAQAEKVPVGEARESDAVEPPATSTGTTDAKERAEESSNGPSHKEPRAATGSPEQPPADRTAHKQLIVVTNRPLEDQDNATAVHSLDEALSEAAALDNPAEIELRFDGLRLLKPFAIDTNRFPENRVAIRAARGCSPLLAFRPSTHDPETAPTPSMIELIGGYVSWEGIHFYLESPAAEGTGVGNKLALFQLKTTKQTEFRDCTFTIRGVDPEYGHVNPRTAFVDVVGPGEFGGMSFDDGPLAEQAPTIWLEDCIARGQASFIRADFAVPLHFSWEHGVFISTQRLLEIGGSIIQPQWVHGEVNVFLSRLLSVADQGICLARSDDVAPYQLRMPIKCSDCLFATQAATPPQSLYLVRTESAFSPTAIPLDIYGNRNYYKNTQIVLRVETNRDRKVIEQYSFDDLTGPESPVWYNEKNPSRAGFLSWEPPSQPVDRQSLQDFTRASNKTWLTTALSLEPSELPELPEIGNMSLEAPDSKGLPPSPTTDTMSTGERPSPGPVAETSKRTDVQ